MDTAGPVLGPISGLAAVTGRGGLGAVAPTHAVPEIHVAAATQSAPGTPGASSFGHGPSAPALTIASTRPHITRPTLPRLVHSPLTRGAGAPPPAPASTGAAVGAIGAGSTGATAALLLVLFSLVAPAIRRHLLMPPARPWPAAPVFLLERPG
jgi:hypothetical protein